jgi:chemotaxis protein methyltransferase CheR
VPEAGSSSPDLLAPVRDFLARRTGVVLDATRSELATLRLRALAQERGLSLPELVDKMPEDGALRDEVLSALLNHETLFFRDHHPFQALRDQILPELVERRRGTRRLRVWSCACSTGQEPYSLAILLEELGLVGWDVELYATDVAGSALERARAGRYSLTEVNRGLPAKLLVEHFVQEGLDWQVKPTLRKRIRFSRLNLIEPWPSLPRMDLVLMRNVLIYLADSTRRAVLRQMREVLSPDGYLLLGGAETTLFTDRAFRPLTVGRATFYGLGSGDAP